MGSTSATKERSFLYQEVSEADHHTVTTVVQGNVNATTFGRTLSVSLYINSDRAFVLPAIVVVAVFVVGIIITLWTSRTPLDLQSPNSTFTRSPVGLQNPHNTFPFVPLNFELLRSWRSAPEHDSDCCATVAHAIPPPPRHFNKHTSNLLQLNNSTGQDTAPPLAIKANRRLL